MKINKRAWAEVSLDAIKNNIREVKRIIQKKCKILAVVKADAYSHGFLEVSRTLMDNGADALGVAFIDEALQLRNYGIDKPILILGHTPEEYVNVLVEKDIIPTVFSKKLADSISSEAIRQNKIAKIHLKIDTGMMRVGFMYNEILEVQNQTIDEISSIYNLPNIEVEGIFTHFSCADMPDDTFTEHQFNLFMDLIKYLENKNINIPIKHVCNSAGIIQHPDMHLDMVRPGIMLYGFYPSEDVDKTRVNLIPAMQFKANITNIKWVDKNIGISYGREYHTDKKTKIATISVGYADGYPRILSGKVKVIANDNFAPVIGRICMDQCMIDVTNVNNINVGDEIILFGRKEDLSISVESLAKLAGTINYEILCVVGKRIPRVYTQNGKIVEVLNYLLKNS